MLLLTDERGVSPAPEGERTRGPGDVPGDSGLRGSERKSGAVQSYGSWSKGEGKIGMVVGVREVHLTQGSPRECTDK